MRSVSDSWDIERRRVSKSLDAVADVIGGLFAAELDRKRFDRALFPKRCPRPACGSRDRGRAGPGHIGKYLEAAGFTISEHVVRDPYDGEATERCYIVAERP